ncbi:MAG TPA: hypothetical protein VK358_17110 [Longimicrobium sp.]|nr:hypothetical protein [Longimicrobium sp.]
MSRAGDAQAFLRNTAEPGYSLEVPGLAYDGTAGRSRMKLLARAREANTLRPAPLGWDRVGALAAEMALHHETERRALDGELATLKEMWRQAEHIAVIADRLPDVPPADPPRL